MNESHSSAPAPAVARKYTRRSGVVVPERATLGGRLAARLIWASVRGVDLTLRYRLHDPANALTRIQGAPAIFAIWHNRLALSLMLYRRYVQGPQPDRRMAAIVSASRDGGMLARVLELFGVQPVRGSSSRRGAQALLEMTSWAERGYDLAVTPDGPRGPRYVVQDGVVDAASLSGLPIVPVCFDLSRRWEVRSWDRFQVPVPFARVEARFGEPLSVPKNVGDAERRALREELQRRLLAITNQLEQPPAPA